MFKRVKNMFKKSLPVSAFFPAFSPQNAAFREWNEKNAIKYGYQSSAIVYSCINVIAKNAASVEWKTYRRNRAGTWEEQQGHPLTALLEKPNPFMSKKDIIERMTHGLYLGGNSVFTKVRGNNGAVLELWPVSNDNINVVPSRENFISHYEYQTDDGRKFRLEPKDVIHNMFLHPSNLFWGMAPIRAAASIIDTDIQAVKWNMHAMQNRAISDGAFVFNEPLTREQWEEARQMIAEQHQGPENARKFWVLGAGTDFKAMSLSPQEMDFIESRRYSRQEIAAIFGVPLPLISIYDDATLANIQTARRIFWLDTLIPYLSDIRSTLNKTLTYEFGNDIYLDFDVSTVDALQENQKEKFENAKTLFSMGVPFNEINKKLDLGFDEVPGGEMGYLPSGLVPAEMFNMQAEATGGPGNEEEDEAKGLPFPRQTKAVNLKTEAHKHFFWHSFERKRFSHDLSMTRKAAKIFKETGERVNAAFKNGGIKAAHKEIDKTRDVWERLFTETWKNIFKEIAPDILQQILSDAKALHGPAAFKAEEEENDDYVEDWLNDLLNYIVETVGLKITNVLDFTKQEVAAIVHEMESDEEAGYSTDDIAKALYKKFEDFSRYRAYVIARTESAGASNFANQSAGEKAAERLERRGIAVFKVWVTSRDSRVRDSHRVLDGKVVGIKEAFTVMEEDEDGELKEAGKLNYPAEYMADMPKNTINCRCTQAYETRRI